MSNSNDRAKQRRERRPRKIVHDAQENAFEAQRVAMSAHMGMSRLSPEVAERNLHNSVMHFYVALWPYRVVGGASKLWRKPILSRECTADCPDDCDGVHPEPFHVGDHRIETLDDLQKIVFGTTERREMRTDHMRGVSTDVEHEPLIMTARQSIYVLLRLNDVAHAHGFRADQTFDIADPAAAEV